MRVGARKGCKEHLERSESASSRTYNNNNNIYNIIIYNTYTHLLYGWWLRHPRGVSLATLAAPSGLPQNNSKKKREGFLPSLIVLYAAAHPYIQYRILYIHRREAAHSSKLCVILIIPKIKNAIPLRAHANNPVITHPQEKNMQRITQRTPNAN